MDLHDSFCNPSADDTLRLYNSLLADYEKEVRPALRHDIPINVTFVFMLTQIIDVKMKREYRGGQTERASSADSQYTKSVMSTDVVVDYLGNVTWAAAAIFKSSCPLDVKHYPFDRQTCTLNYASWAYDGTKIDLLLNSERGDQNNYMMSTEWNLLHIAAEKNLIIYSCCPDAPYPSVNIHITIERRPMFYVFNLILPCVLISGIALLGFYMPSDSGEKVTLGITSLLSTTVFLMLVAEGMPPTSEALPLIGIYYGVTIFLVALATAMTVLTLNVHHQGVHGGEVPPFLQKIAFKFLARVLFVRIDPYHSITHHVRYYYQRDHDDEYEPLLQLTAEKMESPPMTREKLFRDTITKPGLSLSGLNSRNPKKKKVLFSTPGDIPMSPMPTIKHRPSCTAAADQSHMDEFESEFLRVLHLVAMVLDRFLLVVFIIGTAASSMIILCQRSLGIFE
ncbi:unnamed protein product [Nippostrongylus brasiliensis]|uniref:Neuronal acetylcholine receptor subunit alpha-10-like n=1 Tax=Nippostrongylus brasiliensis TaxID=27835 RepID=A0A158R1L1_NIPBR|nr:unnamed protein product [Nippostrongylus brasiliensis]